MPSVTVAPGVINPGFTLVYGYDKFTNWACGNIPLWHFVTHMAEANNCNRYDRDKLIAYHLTKENQGLKDQLYNLHLHGKPPVYILPPRLSFWQRVKAVFRP